ncbi:MAG: hypothetical protein ACR5KV_05625 [Wolbachia sp.]
MELCDKDGNVVTKTKNGAEINISKCNLIGGESIELQNYVRKDRLPSFVIKPSKSGEEGEFIGDKSRAEVYTYDPIHNKVGDKVAKLNATVSEKGNIYNYLLKEGISHGYGNIKHSNIFPIGSKSLKIQQEEEGFYKIDKLLVDEYGKQANKKW